MKTTHIPTLNEAFERWISIRPDLRPGSLNSYRYAYNRMDPVIGEMPLDEIKFSDLKHMYLRMRYEQGLKPNTIDLLNNVINPVFIEAVQDEIITKNPNQGALKAAAKGDAWKTEHRPAVSEEDQIKFMRYIHEKDLYRRWENFFIFLFGTGCRIGETIGLRWENIDFDNELITIDHSVQYLKNKFIEGPTKSSSGTRVIPMIPEVKAALCKEKILAIVTQIVREDNIPGKTGLVFRNNRGSMHHPSCINQAINNIVKDYNDHHPDSEISEFTSVHQTRHTFATRLCENDVNIKVIQAVMGHADISTTMDIYAEVSDAKKRREFEALGGKIIAGVSDDEE